MALHMRKLLACAILAAAFLNTAPLRAQMPEMNNGFYDEKGEPYSSQYFRKTPNRVSLSLQRWPGLQPGKFILHLSTENTVSGCPKLSDLAYETGFRAPYLDITIYDYVVDMRDHPGTKGSSCASGPRNPTADIVLDRDEMIAQGIKRVRFKLNDMADYYDVMIDRQHVWLKPGQSEIPVVQRFRPQKISMIGNPLVHWFYPDKTVILYVPGATGDMDVRDAVMTLAKSNDLEPLENVMPDFSSPVKRPNYYYFIEKKAHLTKNVDIGSGLSVGTVPVEKTIYGLNGDEMAEGSVEVFANSPGLYE